MMRPFVELLFPPCSVKGTFELGTGRDSGMRRSAFEAVRGAYENWPYTLHRLLQEDLGERRVHAHHGILQEQVLIVCAQTG